MSGEDDLVRGDELQAALAVHDDDVGHDEGTGGDDEQGDGDQDDDEQGDGAQDDGDQDDDGQDDDGQDGGEQEYEEQDDVAQPCFNVAFVSDEQGDEDDGEAMGAVALGGLEARLHKRQAPGGGEPALAPVAAVPKPSKKAKRKGGDDDDSDGDGDGGVKALVNPKPHTRLARIRLFNHAWPQLSACGFLYLPPSIGLPCVHQPTPSTPTSGGRPPAGLRYQRRRR